MLRVIDTSDDATELPAIMLQTIRSIKEGEAITVNYGELYWEDSWVCKCSTCDPGKVAASRQLFAPSKENENESPAAKVSSKRKRTRKRKPPMDAGANRPLPERS